MNDPKTSPQREAIRAWERRRRLQPLFAIVGILLLLAAWALRRTALGKAFLLFGVLLIAAARGFQRINCRCPVCGHFNVRGGRGEYHCSVCGFDHYDLWHTAPAVSGHNI